jgi:hypothetical protein
MVGSDPLKERRILRGWRWLKHFLGIEGCIERRKNCSG